MSRLAMQGESNWKAAGKELFTPIAVTNHTEFERKGG
jgi:hypothetical protein